MILTRVELENYKQYIGRHEIDIPNAATVGVIGNNGVGKTTLFEAIEWCLYNPAAIKSKDIRPRGRSGFTKVTVLMEDPATGRNVIVERELKKTATVASIYDVAESGEESLVVSGTKPVSDYVATKLIGLSHQAFVATFFTRQKELSFFGNMGDSERRREVGRLLGLETIRHAQQAIAEDRKRLAADALSYKRLHEQQAAGHDFPAEIAASKEAIAVRVATLGAASAQIETAGKLVAQREGEVQAIETLRDRDASARQLRGQQQSGRQAAHDRRTTVGQDLAHILAREAERAKLLPLAATLPELTERVALLESARERFQRKRELSEQVSALAARRADTLATIAATVRNVIVTEQLTGWMWSPQDDLAPDNAIARVLKVASTLDLPTARLRERQLSDVLDAARRLDEARATHRKYADVLADLEGQRARELAEGDPTTRLAELDAAREVNRTELAGIIARRDQLTGQASQTRTLIGSLEHQHFDDECPTCARPFTEADAGIVLVSLQARLNDLTAQLDRDDRERRQIDADIQTIDGELKEQAAREKTITVLSTRIENGHQKVAEEASRVETIDRECATRLRDAGLTALPSPQEFEDARDRVTLYVRIDDCVPQIERGRAQLAALDRDLATTRTAQEAVADATFDEGQYRAVLAEAQQADRARTSLTHIEQDIARRPDLERERAALTDRIATFDTEIADLDRTLAEIGFDPAALTIAQQALRDARTAEKEAMSASHAAQMALRDANANLEWLEREQERIADLALKAEACQREADTADRMYREFTEFDKYAAAHYTPILGDMTSELVSEVTDGKYDRVEFDGNYGIEIFDGSDERFPLATFSGGERDAIALCARLALSRMIGSQAASPPGFLVLDEVFGSLDRERRTRLLDMLGSISATNDAFRQMFIISHVDDVRSAPLFDELWRIEESEDGVSQIRSLAGHVEVDDL
ncbi:MAG: SMC family ATPase [Thermomicrobiales bacterium]